MSQVVTVSDPHSFTLLSVNKRRTFTIITRRRGRALFSRMLSVVSQSLLIDVDVDVCVDAARVDAVNLRRISH